MESMSAKHFGHEHVCMIQYGHFGDILNVLPIAHHLHQQGNIVHFLCQPPWSDILDATSYVHRVELPKCDFQPMIWYASTIFRRIILARVRADHVESNRIGESYNRDQWYAAGYLGEFDNPDFKLVLDRAPTGPAPFPVRPIVCNVTSGQSSPFKYGPILLQKILAAFPGLVVDVSEMRLPKFVDLLPIMRESKLIVTIDTGMLHLAGACPEIPLVALTNPNPYGGTSIRRHVDARFTYRETRYQPGIVIRAIERILGIEARAGWQTAGEPKDLRKWPLSFQTGRLVDNDMKLRMSAEKAWRMVLDGKTPPPHFHEVMSSIAKRIGVSTDFFCPVPPSKCSKRPIQPQGALLTLPD